MGIEAAMIVTAGSAVPKILMSTVVAVVLLGFNLGCLGCLGEEKRKDDLQLLSEMSSREMIFKKDMIPELKDES
jgi:hypothetical protein